MSKTLAAVAFLAWSLWFGGLIALFIFVQTLFRQDRAIAVEAAPQMFQVFERYQLLLAAMLLLSFFGWWFLSRAIWPIVLFVIIGIATSCAAFGTARITPQMEQLRLDGQSGS